MVLYPNHWHEEKYSNLNWMLNGYVECKIEEVQGIVQKSLQVFEKK